MRYRDTAEIFDELVDLAPSYRGLSHGSLAGTGGRLWPLADPDDPASEGLEVIFGDGFPTPSGRGRFVPAEVLPAKELPDADYPLVLNTGRLLEHWHTGVMTRRSQALDAIAPEAFVEVHPADAARLSLTDGAFVQVSSRRGTIQLRCRVTTRTHEGAVFIPFHFREAAANLLTIDELDPAGKIPEFKYCAVRVERAVSPD
jgi:formate dehydrogenase major subunit